MHLCGTIFFCYNRILCIFASAKLMATSTTGTRTRLYTHGWRMDITRQVPCLKKFCSHDETIICCFPTDKKGDLPHPHRYEHASAAWYPADELLNFILVFDLTCVLVYFMQFKRIQLMSFWNCACGSWVDLCSCVVHAVQSDTAD